MPLAVRYLVECLLSTHQASLGPMGKGVTSREESAAAIQAAYYERTAASYDATHVRVGDEHFVAAQYLSYLVDGLNIRSLLDVGAGTGRAIKFLRERHPGLRVAGIEPVQALIDQAVDGGLDSGIIALGRGEALPFQDGAFDAVCEFGALHHVSNPKAVVGEMIRVAKRAVFLSDSNRFGQGGRPHRFVKLALASAHLWGFANWVKTRGKRYSMSEGDGLGYSYSVFDSLPTLMTWADRIILVPTLTDKAVTGLYHPLLTSRHLLIGAIK